MTSAPRNASAARVVSHHLTVAPATPATIDTAQWFKHNKNERQVEKPPALLGCNLLRLGQNCEIVEFGRFRVGSSICSMIFLDIFVWICLVSPEANAGLPTAHMGGVGGFTSLADGIDRALAGTCTIMQMQMVVFFWKI